MSHVRETSSRPGHRHAPCGSTLTRLAISLPQVLATVTALAIPRPVLSAPVLQSAVGQVRFLSSAICQVALTSVVGGAATMEHRIEVTPGTQVEMIALRGGSMERRPADVGRTRAIVVRPAGGEYTLDYRVSLPPDRVYRCPLWLPAAPADGRSRNVRIEVTIPDGASAAGTMPSFAWTGSVGTTTVGHLPSFVLVPFAAPGSPRPWDVSHLMDTVALTTLVLASLVWLRRARARRPAAEHARAETAHG